MAEGNGHANGIRAYDLKTLSGIGMAREVIFNGLMNGEIPEDRAMAAERMLRGQQTLKGDLRLRALGMLLRTQDKRFDRFVNQLADGVAEFVTGSAMLPPAK